MLESLEALLPQPLQSIVARLPTAVRGDLEEIRVREGRPLEIVYGRSYAFVTESGAPTDMPQRAFVPSREDCSKLLDLLTNHSVYSFEEELKRGYITIAGGHRVGLAGRTVLEHGRVKLIRDIGSFSLRIAREVRDCGTSVLPHLVDAPAGTVHHTLVVSPPQHGKTTLIRDLARLVSYGCWPQTMRAGGRKVGVVDERSELAACVKGVPRFDLGPRTDVLDACPKAEGMMMLIRSMSPEVLVVDEIGKEEDALAVEEALHAGIRVIASAHGRDYDDCLRRPALRKLLGERLFARIVLLRKESAGDAAFTVFDASGNRLAETAARQAAGGRWR